VSLQVVFRPQAEGEALEVRHWYESRSSGLGEQFSNALEALIERTWSWCCPSTVANTRRNGKVARRARPRGLTTACSRRRSERSCRAAA